MSDHVDNTDKIIFAEVARSQPSAVSRRRHEGVVMLIFLCHQSLDICHDSAQLFRKYFQRRQDWYFAKTAVLREKHRRGSGAFVSEGEGSIRLNNAFTHSVTVTVYEHVPSRQHSVKPSATA